jgi:hypothetical protein
MSGIEKLLPDDAVPEPPKGLPRAPEARSTVVWKFHRAKAKHSNVGWNKATAKELQTLRRKLAEIEQLPTANLIDGRKFKWIKVEQLRDPYPELLRNAFNDEDMPNRLLRIMVDGKCRIWVSEAEPFCFEFLWWDPKHCVAP